VTGYLSDSLCLSLPNRTLREKADRLLETCAWSWHHFFLSCSIDQSKSLTTITHAMIWICEMGVWKRRTFLQSGYHMHQSIEVSACMERSGCEPITLAISCIQPGGPVTNLWHTGCPPWVIHILSNDWKIEFSDIQIQTPYLIMSQESVKIVCRSHCLTDPISPVTWYFCSHHFWLILAGSVRLLISNLAPKFLLQAGWQQFANKYLHLLKGTYLWGVSVANPCLSHSSTLKNWIFFETWTYLLMDTELRTLA
jgi:hypothetical protein